MSHSLLPHNATQGECALALATARIGSVPVVIEHLWDADTCPLDFLPWLAWTLSVDDWESDWGEEQKRQIIQQSAILHLKKGTKGALKRKLEALGVKINIKEWFEPDSGLPPHTFRLVSWVNTNLAPKGDVVLGSDLYSSLKRLVDSVKPVRSHYDFRVGVAFGHDLGIYNVMKAVQSLHKEAKAQQKLLKSRSEITIVTLLKTADLARKQMTPKAVTKFKKSWVTVASISKSVVLAQFFMEAT